MQPILFVTSDKAKSDVLDPVSLFILFLPNTNKLSLNFDIPVILLLCLIYLKIGQKDE